MAARIEFERDWLPKFNQSTPTVNEKTSPSNKAERKQKTLAALGTKNTKINNVIDNFFS
jgi:Holliday junction resolvasome RuvABC DNA-binding subunit